MEGRTQRFWWAAGTGWFSAATYLALVVFHGWDHPEIVRTLVLNDPAHCVFVLACLPVAAGCLAAAFDAKRVLRIGRCSSLVAVTMAGWWVVCAALGVTLVHLDRRDAPDSSASAPRMFSPLSVKKSSVLLDAKIGHDLVRGLLQDDVSWVGANELKKNSNWKDIVAQQLPPSHESEAEMERDRLSGVSILAPELRDLAREALPMVSFFGDVSAKLEQRRKAEGLAESVRIRLYNIIKEARGSRSPVEWVEAGMTYAISLLIATLVWYLGVLGIGMRLDPPQSAHASSNELRYRIAKEEGSSDSRRWGIWALERPEVLQEVRNDLTVGMALLLLWFPCRLYSEWYMNLYSIESLGGYTAYVTLGCLAIITFSVLVLVLHPARGVRVISASAGTILTVLTLFGFLRPDSVESIARLYESLAEDNPHIVVFGILVLGGAMFLWALANTIALPPPPERPAAGTLPLERSNPLPGATGGTD